MSRPIARSPLILVLTLLICGLLWFGVLAQRHRALLDARRTVADIVAVQTAAAVRTGATDMTNSCWC